MLYKIFIAIILIVILVIILASVKICRRRMYIWLPGYINQGVRRRIKPKPHGLTHVIFAMADHFEPQWRNPDRETEQRRFDAWIERYPEMAGKHVDSDGRHPQHTFFYPPHEYREEHLDALAKMCGEGYGEVEFHLHHEDDDMVSLRKLINETIELYAKHGVFTHDGDPKRRSYAFVHGNWCLDNSRYDGKYCGVNNELRILRETGCFADFTFPAPNECQPQQINSIYYAIDDPEKPKSYNRGVPVAVGGSPIGDMMIVQGPMGMRRRPGRPVHSTEDSTVNWANPPTPERMDYWVSRDITVTGRPEWVFVKVHCHGAQDKDLDVMLGEASDKFYSYLEEKYNDLLEYQLHYVTAREMYNIIKAAEAGNTGDPNQYRDFAIPPYTHSKKY